MSQLIDLYKKILRAPGEGVYTVSNAKERKQILHHQLYGSTDHIESQWHKSLAQDLTRNFSGIAMLGVPSDTGGGIQRGANWGPLFVRLELYKRIEQHSILDLGDVFVVPHLLHDKYLESKFRDHVAQAIYNESSPLPVSPLSIAELATSEFYKTHPKAKLFSIGGDHSVSYPLVKAWAQADCRKGKKIGLIHFDAHTDLMIERLGVDLCFGSWVTHIIDCFKSPSNIYQIGIRSSARDRAHWETTFQLHQVWADEIHKKGMATVLNNFADYLKQHQFDEVYVSFDIDALDSEYAPATGTPEKGGLEPYQAKMFIDEISKHTTITGADMVEVAPFVQIEPDPMAQFKTTTNAALLSQALIEAMQG